jgi:hypothetical protein
MFSPPTWWKTAPFISNSKSISSENVPSRNYWMSGVLSQTLISFNEPE